MSRLANIAELESAIGNYQARTGNCDRRSIVICLSTDNYHRLVLLIDNLYIPWKESLLDKNKFVAFNGVSCVVSDDFGDTPIIAERIRIKQ